MTINVNNQPQSVSEHITLKEVVAQLNIVSTGIAIAINIPTITKTTNSSDKVNALRFLFTFIVAEFCFN